LDAGGCAWDRLQSVDRWGCAISMPWLVHWEIS
jgi:hypothetical protein